MRFNLALSITLFGIIGALIWVSRPEGPHPTEEELKRELFVAKVHAAQEPTKLDEGELARAFRVVSGPARETAQASSAQRQASRKVYADDSIPGSRLAQDLESKDEREAAKLVLRRLGELSPSDALERVVLREFVRNHIRSTELAREIAMQEMRADNVRNLPPDPAWQVDYMTSYMNIYLESGKNDDTTLGSAIEAVASQTNEQTRLAMSQALLSRAHDGSLSVQEALQARGVVLPSDDHGGPKSGPLVRPEGAVEGSF